MVRRRRLRAAVVLALFLPLAGAGCGAQSAEGPGASPGSTSKPSAEPPEVAPPVEAPPSPEELRHEAAVEIVDSMAPRELAGTLMMSSVPTTDPAQLLQVMANTGLGGFLLMGANIPASPELLHELTAALTDDAGLPPFIAIDEEGGLVKRLPWDEYPGANTLRASPVSDASAAFKGRAEMLTRVGINVNFGIVADVAADPRHFIYWRSLGDTPSDIAERVAAAVRAEQGVIVSTLKHFPGHGAAPGDSHYSIPTTDTSFETWATHDRVPFEAGVAAGAEMLMFGHLAYTAVSPLPSSLSPEWYTIARDELGFDGVTITDDLAMLQANGLPEYRDPGRNIISALSAGADMALIVSGMDEDHVAELVDRVASAIKSGELYRARAEEAAVRVTELRLELAERRS